MEQHLFDRVIVLGKEVNLEEETKEVLVFLDAIQEGVELENMYGKTAEFCVDLRRRTWLRGSKNNWETWVYDRELLEEFFEVIHNVLEPLLESPRRILAAALYVQLGRVWPWSTTNTLNYSKARKILRDKFI